MQQDSPISPLVELQSKEPSPDRMKKIRSELDRVVDEANALSMYMMQDPVLQLRFQGDLGVLFFKLMMLSDQLEEPDIEHKIDAMSDTIDAFRRAIMMTAV